MLCGDIVLLCLLVWRRGEHLPISRSALGAYFHRDCRAVQHIVVRHAVYFIQITSGVGRRVGYPFTHFGRAFILA
jgi:hypothetical protein